MKLQPKTLWHCYKTSYIDVLFIPGFIFLCGKSNLYKVVNCPLQDISTLNVQDGYHGRPADQAPMITTMAVSSDVPLVESMFGQVQEGNVLSYQLPTRTVPMTRPHTVAPSPPQPLSDQCGKHWNLSQSFSQNFGEHFGMQLSLRLAS